MSAAPGIKLMGVPYDAHSSFLQGPALAPAAVRAALACGAANWCAESGRDFNPDATNLWSDLGDLHLPEAPELVQQALDEIRGAAIDAIADGSRLLSIGGDHLVTWPLVEAVAQHHDQLTILHFDAHPDLYDELDGDRFSHACPFARIMEAGTADRLVQIGIRTMTPHQAEQAERFRVEVLPMNGWDGQVPELSGPVYVTIDIDALDPAFAPGISHHEPGGMTTRQLLDCLHQVRTMDVHVVAADVVEINPARDINDMTAMVGAKLVRELMDLMVVD